MGHMLQLQVGRVDERGEHRPLPASTSERSDYGAFQGGEIVRCEVREVGVLRVAPHGLHRVEVGRVGGQPFEDDPRVLAQPGRDTDGPVGPMPIPDERVAMGQVPAQGLEESEDLGASDVVPIQRPVETESAAARGHCERADDGEPVTAVPLSEDRCLAARCPGPAADGLEHKTALIQEDEASAGAAGVFLYAASAPCANAEWLPRPAPGLGAPVSGNSTLPRGGFSRHERGGSAPQRCDR